MATDKKAAAAFVAAQFEPLVASRYEGIDNPKAKIVTTYRVRHNIITKPKLKAFHNCIRQKFKEYNPKGEEHPFKKGTTLENIKAERDAFKKAAQACKSS